MDPIPTKHSNEEPDCERDLGYDGRFINSYSSEELQEKVIDILKQQPGVPFSVLTLAEMLGMSPFQIDIALEAIEGPVDGSDQPGAYIYLARSSNQAIYIP